jgi:hypothetical protein
MKSFFKKRGAWRWRAFVLGISFAGFAGALQGQSFADMSCYRLWYLRNSIFAQKGYCFTSAEAISTFGRRCYPPYGRLSRWEEDEVESIRYWERRKGCPSRVSTPPPSYDNGVVRGYARVSGIRFDDTLAVRSGPSTRYTRIGDLPPDADGIEILECTRGWCRIRYGGLTGWSYAKYLRSR